jgi:hypothetical protein
VTRADRRTLVRQLHEEGLSRRAIAERLGVGKDTVRRDLAAIEREPAPESAPPGAPDVPDAPQVSEGDAPEGAPQGESPRPLPRRMAQPLAGIDLSKWPAVRRDLAVLAQTGRTAEALAHQAITALAHHYARALACGEIAPGQEFFVSSITLRPLPRPGARPPSPAEAV